jgi:hypothetical protein
MGCVACAGCCSAPVPGVDGAAGMAGAGRGDTLQGCGGMQHFWGVAD